MSIIIIAIVHASKQGKFCWAKLLASTLDGFSQLLSLSVYSRIATLGGNKQI